MKNILRALGLSLILLIGTVVNADPVKESIAMELAFIKRVFEVGYAPTAWKKQHFNWDLQAEYQKAKDTLVNKTDVSALEYRQIVGGLLTSMRDYHVGYSFLATERASLPLGVYSVNGRTFIVWIDTRKLSPETFPFQVGDELIEWNGRPMTDVMKDMQALMKTSEAHTDARMADLVLTSRRAARGLQVPQGRVDLVVKRPSNGQVIARQLTWEYVPETIEWNSNVQLMAPFSVAAVDSSQFLRPQMTWGWANAFADLDQSRWAIGGRTSYVPRLGEVKWTSGPTDKFDAYTYVNAAGKTIGYIRIPHYGESTLAFVSFRNLIAKFQAETDALVIDQVNNPGGSVLYVMALMTVLSDQPIKVPPHHIALWPTIVSRSLQIRNEVAVVKNDADAKIILGNDIDGYPVNYQMVEGLREYVRGIEAAWKNKERVTQPLPLFGMDRVNPDAQVAYTKPILVLTNELDFSGGDFFPGILQDNKRAKVFGQRTAGAGGYVVSVQFPSSLGLESFSFTGSLARRVNGAPLENLGVTPDFPYTMTEKDFSSDFSDYKAAVNAAVDEIMK
ncbi:MAG: protease-like activity factor CPAF [Bdellovibrionales bacterium]|nr:protease-like activity factor CPAF [Bdellovibrionales bacterium]